MWSFDVFFVVSLNNLLNKLPNRLRIETPSRPGDIIIMEKYYSGVMMGVMAFQITSLTIVYSTVDSGTDERKHQSSASLAFVRGIHRWPVNSPDKWPVTRKMFPFDDVTMISVAITGPLCTEPAKRSRFSFNQSVSVISVVWINNLSPRLDSNPILRQLAFVLHIFPFAGDIISTWLVDANMNRSHATKWSLGLYIKASLFTVVDYLTDPQPHWKKMVNVLQTIISSALSVNENIWILARFSLNIMIFVSFDNFFVSDRL